MLLKRSHKLATCLLFLTAASGCGKQAFQVTDLSEAQQAPGTYTIAPKVDILLAEDDSGSITQAYDAIASQLPAFLTNLESRGWDYHFATTTLTRDRAISEVLASKHDGNWGSQWQQPFPGALQFGPGTVVSGAFRTPDTYSQFIDTSDINYGAGSLEPGFEAIRTALTGSAATTGTGFLRPDALLVVLVMGNGNDTSGVPICDYYLDTSSGPQYQGTGPCGQSAVREVYRSCSPSWACTSTTSSAPSFTTYKNAFLALKPSAAQLKMYSVVSPKKGSCLGGQAFIGTRYANMASELGGQAYDICSTPVATALDGIGTNLTSQRLSFRTRFLFVATEPEESTIVVKRSSGAVIPNDAANGWTYVGAASAQSGGGVYAIDSPIDMNFVSSGFAIELHGAAKLLGDESASVTYKPKGAQDSAEN